jgi:hypothetical protein
VVVVRLAFTAGLSMFQPAEFEKISVSEFLNGRENLLIKAISAVKRNVSPKDTGLLLQRSGLSNHIMTVSRREENAAMIIKIDGKELLDIWKSETCNRLNVSDGMIFNPKLLKNKEKLYTFAPDFLRSLPLEFEEEVCDMNSY